MSWYSDGWNYGGFEGSADKAWDTYRSLWGIRFPERCPYQFRNGFRDRVKSTMRSI